MANDLNNRINSGTMLNTASAISCVTGILIFGMGVSGAVFLYYSTLGVNIANAMLPIMREKKAHSHFPGS